MNPQTALLILKILDLLSTAVLTARELREEYDALSGKLREMVESGRNPTDDEFDQLSRDTDSLVSKLRGS